MPQQFDHEKLNVYHATLRFVVWTTDLLERIPKSLAVHNQLDRASTSMPLNIAEGSGKWTPPDRCRFLDNARGSALECAAALDVLVSRKVLCGADIESGKELLIEFVSMLVGLLRANLPQRFDERTGRVREEGEEYGKGKEQDQSSGAAPC